MKDAIYCAQEQRCEWIQVSIMNLLAVNEARPFPKLVFSSSIPKNRKFEVSIPYKINFP